MRVESGELRGMATNSVMSFLGVPYARPPVGPLRWAPPQKAESWRGVRDATKPGPIAAQGLGNSPGGSTNEDCLYLNITTPRIVAKAKPKPVMVWLHGGGFSGGNAGSYDPRRMVIEGDVVVVTVEFRLNIFGCFGYPGLPDSGTFILLDQQAALAWIQRNIAVFGGDPKNVTLFGESGGAIAACAQLTSPPAKGLFHNAILQSGAVTTSWPPNAANLGPDGSFWRPLKEVEAAGEELAVKMGCPERKGSPEALRWLRDQPVTNLLAHSRAFATAAYGGRVLPYHPALALQEGHFNAVPVISGYTRDEGRALALGMQLTGGGVPMTEDGYQKLLRDAFGERAPEVEAQYPKSRYPSPTLAWSAIYTDRMFACPQFTATRALAERAPAFAYEFADTNAPGLMPFFPGFAPGASHSGELPFLFDVGNSPVDMTGKHVPLTGEQMALAATMIQYWTQFAHAGDPNGKGTPPWPRFVAKASQAQVQTLAPDPIGIKPASDAALVHQCEFWGKFMK
ncbi:MAG TPA: carboxylesterase family protein [Verrucomicrobiae bacterium]|nr:carboxylesterase family protein [Verrucomicrobiae bacterium]